MFASQKTAFDTQPTQAPGPDRKFKGMRFCDECDNMLEPKEFSQDSERHFLLFECKLCKRNQRAVEGDELDNCVYRTDYTQKAENLQVDPECVKDPTLTRRRDIICKWCQHTEAVSFTQVTKEKLNLIFVCCKCTKHWHKGEGPQDDAQLYSDDSD